jgi:DNA-binding LacI/PurR family transcriptional regulator
VNGSVTGSIGYVICKEKASRKPISTEVFYFDVFSGIEEVTAESGRHVLFMYLDDFDQHELATFHTFLEKVDGLVIEEARNLSFLHDIKKSRVPTVLLAPTVSIEGIDLIAMDLAEGVGKAVRYLHGLGHERIAIINGPLHLDSAKIRYEAWEKTLGELGLSTERDLFAGGDGWTVETGFTAMQGLLEGNTCFTAVLCANDLIAIGALSALSQAQRSIPRDVSIMGFDDTELARLASPPLTSMKIYSRDMAHSAAQRLIERIGHHSLPPIRIEYPIDLVERQSCGKPDATPRHVRGD